MLDKLKFYYHCEYIEVYCLTNLNNNLDKYKGIVKEFERNRKEGYLPLVQFEEAYGKISDVYGMIAFQLALFDIAIK